MFKYTELEIANNKILELTAEIKKIKEQTTLADGLIECIEIRDFGRCGSGDYCNYCKYVKKYK